MVISEKIIEIMKNEPTKVRKAGSAFDFVINANTNEDTIIDEINNTLLRIKYLYNLDTEKIDNFDLEVELEYLKRLNEGNFELQEYMILKQDDYEKIKVRIDKKALPLDGRGDAIERILSLLEKGDDLEILINEVEEKEAYIFKLLREGNKSMLSGSTPGIYNRGYISTMKEFIGLISNL